MKEDKPNCQCSFVAYRIKFSVQATVGGKVVCNFTLVELSSFNSHFIVSYILSYTRRFCPHTHLPFCHVKLFVPQPHFLLCLLVLILFRFCGCGRHCLLLIQYPVYPFINRTSVWFRIFRKKFRVSETPLHCWW